MRFQDLGLKMGDAMQAQLSSDSEARYPVKLLGFIPEHSVIISAPKTSKGGIVLVREAQVMTLRFVANGVASGFSSKILASRASPYPYLHLEIPDDIQTVDVKQAVSVQTNIAATMINETRKSSSLKVMMTSLSVLGCQIECEKKIALINDEMSLTMTLELERAQRVATLEGKVVKKQRRSLDDSVSEEEDEEGEFMNIYQLEFLNSDEEDELLLRAFVYQEILRSLNMI
ncbi:flagellar brake protein [Pleionea sp. CnH1-48]|uniref:flagellar brake protein n=1 Tax=Pleionea sp. CnH1-48 TaxID=2954494 RepID=UPI0020979FA2|nr:flagellar brake protein [Pleionea sp. CnH1-48]MCO7222761.1 flagellar brake protein [Pleionea sp. CnH1-48]